MTKRSDRNVSSTRRYRLCTQLHVVRYWCWCANEACIVRNAKKKQKNCAMCRDDFSTVTRAKTNGQKTATVIARTRRYGPAVMIGGGGGGRKKLNTFYEFFLFFFFFFCHAPKNNAILDFAEVKIIYILLVRA